VILGIADDGDPPAASDDDIALGHALYSVVCALGMDVRAQKPDQIAYVETVKDRDRVHIRERCQDLGALVFRHARPAGAFQSTNTGIGVDRDHNPAPQLLGCAQIPHMPNMQQIKTAVGEDDLLAGGAPEFCLLGKLVEADNLLC